MNPVAFSVPVRELRALARFVSKDESRYVLTGVLFELKGSVCNLVATDARRLAAMQVELSSPEPIEEKLYIIEVGQVLNWKLNTYYDDIGDSHDEVWPSEKVLIQIFGTCVYMNCGHHIAAGSVIDGHFPNWRTLFKTYSFNPGQSDCVAVNSEFLHDFGLARKEITGQFMPQIAILQLETPECPMLIDIGVPKFTGLLMPVMTGDKGLDVSTREKLTSWIT